MTERRCEMDQALEQIVMVTLVIYRSWEIAFKHQCFFMLKVCLSYIPNIFKKNDDTLTSNSDLIGRSCKEYIDFMGSGIDFFCKEAMLIND